MTIETIHQTRTTADVRLVRTSSKVQPFAVVVTYDNPTIIGFARFEYEMLARREYERCVHDTMPVTLLVGDCNG